MYHITKGLDPTKHSVIGGLDPTQAICQAVHEALVTAAAHPTPHTFLWLRSQPLCDKLLTLKPYRDTYITADIHHAFAHYLTTNESFTLHLCHFNRAWPGTPSNADIQNLRGDMDSLAATPKPLSQQLPRTAMWGKIHTDYTLPHRMHPTYQQHTTPSYPGSRHLAQPPTLIHHFPPCGRPLL